MENDSEVKFVTDLEVSGFLNGVLNMAFSTAQFIPVQEIDPENMNKTRLVVSQAPKITVNLRFDLRLAQIIRDRLDELIDENTKSSVPKATN